MNRGDPPTATEPRALPRPAASATAIPHLYVHYPFCARKCPYCDFNSHAGRDGEIDRYVEALTAEARTWRGRVAAKTVFVGGGTPTHASADVLERYLLGVREALDFGSPLEFTVEANPGSLDRRKVRALRRVGVNRMSLGVQSFDDRHLGTLGRIHDAADAVRGIEILREGGIERVSLDIMLAIPGQTLAEQDRDLSRALDLAPEHISAYVLTYEEGTAFTRLMREGRLPAPDDDRELAHLHRARDAFAAAGYDRYEISNFARPGAESLHNLGYWNNAQWLGLGAGAHSHVGGERWKNQDDPAGYAKAVIAGERPEAWRERIAPEQNAFESLLMGLRLARGVDLDRVERESGIDIELRFHEAVARHRKAGLLRLEGRRLALTARGFDLANYVIASFAPAA